MNRRKLLQKMISAGGAVIGGIVGIPALVAALTPAWQRRLEGSWRRVGRVDDFQEDQVTKGIVQVQRGDWARSLEEKSVYVWKRPGGEEGQGDEFVVFSRNCTDLSCPVTFDPGSECFFCPCHGGIFAKDGRPMAGPPRVPLYRYATRVREGRLEIDLASLPPIA